MKNYSILVVCAIALCTACSTNMENTDKNGAMQETRFTYSTTMPAETEFDVIDADVTNSTEITNANDTPYKGGTDVTELADVYAQQLNKLFAEYDLGEAENYTFAVDTNSNTDMYVNYIVDNATPEYIVRKPDTQETLYNTNLLFCDINNDGVPEMGVGHTVWDSAYTQYMYDFYDQAGETLGTCMPFTYLAIKDATVYGVTYAGNVTHTTKMVESFPTTVVAFDYVDGSNVVSGYITDTEGTIIPYSFSNTDLEAAKESAFKYIIEQTGTDIRDVPYEKYNDYILQPLYLQNPTNYTESDLCNAVVEMLTAYTEQCNK